MTVKKNHEVTMYKKIFYSKSLLIKIIYLVLVVMMNQFCSFDQNSTTNLIVIDSNNVDRDIGRTYKLTTGGACQNPAQYGTGTITISGKNWTGTDGSAFTIEVVRSVKNASGTYFNQVKISAQSSFSLSAYQFQRSPIACTGPNTINITQGVTYYCGIYIYGGDTPNPATDFTIIFPDNLSNPTIYPNFDATTYPNTVYYSQ